MTLKKRANGIITGSGAGYWDDMVDLLRETRQVVYPFVNGTTFLSAGAAAQGWEIDLATEYAAAFGQQASLYDVKITGIDGYCVDATNATGVTAPGLQDSYFENCNFEASSGGVYLRAQIYHFVRCNFGNLNDAAEMAVKLAEGGAYTFINCTFTGNDGYDIAAVTGGPAIEYCLFNGCWFEESTGGILYDDGVGTGPYFHHLEFRGCRFHSALANADNWLRLDRIRGVVLIGGGTRYASGGAVTPAVTLSQNADNIRYLEMHTYDGNNTLIEPVLTNDAGYLLTNDRFTNQNDVSDSGYMYLVCTQKMIIDATAGKEVSLAGLDDVPNRFGGVHDIRTHYNSTGVIHYDMEFWTKEGTVDTVDRLRYVISSGVDDAVFTWTPDGTNTRMELTNTGLDVLVPVDMNSNDIDNITIGTFLTRIDIDGTTNANINIDRNAGANQALVTYQTNGVNSWEIGTPAGQTYYHLYDGVNAQAKLQVRPGAGDFDILNADLDLNTNDIKETGDIYPTGANAEDLGSGDHEFKDAYIAGRIYLFTDQEEYIYSDGSFLILGAGGGDELKLNSTELTPNANAGLSLGTDALEWNDAYIDGTAYIDTLTVEVGLDVDAIDVNATGVGSVTAVVPVTSEGGTNYIALYDGYS